MEKQSHCKKASILVTGGGGFLGSAICKDLLQHGFAVHSFSRRHYAKLQAIGVSCHQGDLANSNDIDRALVGIDAVIHTAALAGVWGKHADYMKANVTGTENLLAAMVRCGIRKLVHTSSPSVVFDGKNIRGADEKIPYATKYTASYPYSKKIAEDRVQAANRSNQIDAVLLRPHLIWGPDDPHFLPRLREKSRKGKLVKVGRGCNKVDTIYVDNAALAHRLALEKIFDSPESVRGKSFFIGQDEPTSLWSFLDELLVAIGEPKILRRLPYPIAYAAGAALETIYRGLNIYSSEPPITRFVAAQLALSHYFDHSSARNTLGYRPQISTREGLRRLSENRIP